jgi:hypothetical protein
VYGMEAWEDVVERVPCNLIKKRVMLCRQTCQGPPEGEFVGIGVTPLVTIS